MPLNFFSSPTSGFSSKKETGINILGTEQYTPTQNLQKNLQYTYSPTTSSIYAPTTTTTKTDARSIALILNSPDATQTTKKEVSSSPVISPDISPYLVPQINPALQGGAQTGGTPKSGIDLNKILIIGGIALVGYALISKNPLNIALKKAKEKISRRKK